ISFLCDVENTGIQRQENVSVSVAVRKKEDGMLVFSDTVQIGAIGPDTIIQDSIFKRKFTPPAVPERYEVSYHVFNDSTDQAPEDNFINWTFEISEDTYAKEKGPTTQIRPISNPYSFQYGNCFYIPKGQGFEAREVTFGISNTDELANQRVTVIVYKFYSDENENGFIEPEEYEIIGLGDYKIQGTEYLFNDGIIQTTVYNLDNEPGVALEDNTYYIIALQYIDITGFSCLMYASQEFDYYPMFYGYNRQGINRFGAVEEISAKFDLFSLGFDLIPLIRLHIKPINSGVSKNGTGKNEVKIFPNPAAEYFTVNAFPGKGTLDLYAPDGKKVRTWSIEDYINFFPLGTLPSGNYILHFNPDLKRHAGWSRQLTIHQ
ncbi:MAG: T9SS type A sorting domain-containing protein, partial [Saprospiraceae bacterium]|nr:T9SS type A sorting domain-containing protein [Saprospiraceae bacterium]